MPSNPHPHPHGQRVGGEMTHEEIMAEISRPSTRIRFEAKVVRIPEAGCWVWLGSLRGRGYGFFHLGGKSDRKGTGAHRISWALHHGFLPDSSVDVCHHCDNPLCVNPGHLFLGTRSDNMKDCGAKGRISTVGKSQLTHCVHGHEFTPENTRITPIGHRSCRACEKTRAAIRARGTKEGA